MSEPLRYASGQTPELLYATRQTVASSTVTRAVHRHERFTEMLYVYQGAGQYIAGGYSYPIRTGDILLYNQGDLHEVTSSLHHEIGTFCFGIPVFICAACRRDILPGRKPVSSARRSTRSTISSRCAR